MGIWGKITSLWIVPAPISLPSPLCLTYNFFLWMDWSDPGNMLEWLVGQLVEAELAGEKVTLLSHVPPGNGEGDHARRYLPR